MSDDIQEAVPAFRKAALIGLATQLGLPDVAAALQARNEADLPWTMDFYVPLSAQIQAKIEANDEAARQLALNPPPKVGWLV